MANERASSNVDVAAIAKKQVMNINNTTRAYMKVTGGGEIPPLPAHARAVGALFPPPPCPPLSERLGMRLSCSHTLSTGGHF